MLQQIQAFLIQRQWEFEQLDEETLLTGFTSPLPDGQDHGFPLFVMRVEDQFSDEYTRLVIVPYVQQPGKGFSRDLLLRVVTLNHDMPLLRFAIDDAGDLELMVDIPAKQLNQTSFDTAMQVLADYAGLRYADVASLATEAV